MIFRKTTAADIPALEVIFDGARETMHAAGIAQWLNGYPAVSDLRADIARGVSYVLTEDDGTIVSTAAVIPDGEDTYEKIDGKWLTDSSCGNDCTFCAVHRTATAKNQRGRGRMSHLIEEAANFARTQGKRSIRIDTHRDNLPMQRMLARNGFAFCGVILLHDGAARNAYEKII